MDYSMSQPPQAQTQTSSTGDPLRSSWHRWFRRTNVYAAEYILMLILMGVFLGTLVSLWHSFFNMIVTDGSAGSAVAKTAAMALASVLVVGPAAFWMYSRVTGEESQNSSHLSSKARSVFLIMWVIVATLALVGVAAGIASSVFASVFGYSQESTPQVWVGSVVGGLFGLATLAYGIIMVIKHASRKMVMMACTILASVTLVLFLASLLLVIVRNGHEEQQQQKDSSQYLNDYLKNLKNSQQDSYYNY